MPNFYLYNGVCSFIPIFNAYDNKQRSYYLVLLIIWNDEAIVK